MAIELSFKVDGKMQTFKKDNIYFKDNIRAVKHTIVQTEYYEAEKQTEEAYEQMQNDFCEMISDIFNNDFSAEQLKNGITLDNLRKLDDIFTLALGGKLKKEEETEKK